MLYKLFLTVLLTVGPTVAEGLPWGDVKSDGPASVSIMRYSTDVFAGLGLGFDPTVGRKQTGVQVLVTTESQNVDMFLIEITYSVKGELFTQKTTQDALLFNGKKVIMWTFFDANAERVDFVKSVRVRELLAPRKDSVVQ